MRAIDKEDIPGLGLVFGCWSGRPEGMQKCTKNIFIIKSFFLPPLMLDVDDDGLIVGRGDAF